MNNFEKLFNSIYTISGQKEYLNFHKKRFKYLYKVINELNPKNILDIGKSDFSSMLKSAGYNVSILNKTECDLGKDRIPYQDNTFNLVIYTEVIEHLNQNYLGSLQEIYRITKPNGFVLFGTPNAKSLWKLFKNKKINKVHIREFSMNECLAMLRMVGFDIIFNKFMPYLDYTKKYPFDYTRKEPVHFLYYYFVKYIPRLQESILILAKK